MSAAERAVLLGALVPNPFGLSLSKHIPSPAPERITLDESWNKT
jgi:hypothetical protein